MPPCSLGAFLPFGRPSNSRVSKYGLISGGCNPQTHLVPICLFALLFLLRRRSRGVLVDPCNPVDLALLVQQCLVQLYEKQHPAC